MVKHDKIFCHKKFRGTYSSVGMLKGYMAKERLRSPALFGSKMFVFNENFMFVKIVHYISRNNEQAG